MPAPASGDQKSATGQVLAERSGTDIGWVGAASEQLWAGMRGRDQGNEDVIKEED